jgi:site-specific DNA-methyltransferase (cytosine-N4-specific)
MVDTRSDLPFGSEFSPSQINLPELLEIIARHPGDPQGLEAEIRATYFASHAARSANAGKQDYNRSKLANNCKLGLIAYGIIDREAKLTKFGH